MRFVAYINVLVVLFLAIYGLYYLVLLLLYLRHRRETDVTPAVDLSALPHVTVQVPVYNERHVVERAIDHVVALDYPRDRLHIQILDDSTDETSRLACARAAFYRRRGIDIEVLHRPDRSGFKAGALDWGLSHAQGEYTAVFDADFCPYPDFLLRTVPYFLERSRLGFVQGRWTYLNVDYSLLTKAQMLAFDSHYNVEQIARSRSGGRGVAAAVHRGSRGLAIRYPV
jgi:cellulose synthase/poly-beta-1,6-N-acetylglucosamine synthase-like glycosyltransferase